MIVLVFMLGLHFQGFGQIFKQLDLKNVKENIDLEIGCNRSRITNISQLQSNTVRFSDGTSITYNIEDEVASYTNNLSVSMGVRLYKGHRLRLRIARNYTGSSLAGNIVNSAGGTVTILEMRYDRNKSSNLTLGLLYEYVHPVAQANLTFSFGIEQQSYFFSGNVFTPSQESLLNALYGSIGFTRPVHSVVDIYGRTFVSRSLSNSTVFESTLGSYLPLQIGLELGLRINFTPFPK